MAEKRRLRMTLFCHPEAKPKGLMWRFFPFADPSHKLRALA